MRNWVWVAFGLVGGMLLTVSPAGAQVLEMTGTVRACDASAGCASGRYRYDFTLTTSGALREGIGWLIFADTGSSAPSTASRLNDVRMLGPVPRPWTSLTSSGGGHNGPTFSPVTGDGSRWITTGPASVTWSVTASNRVDGIGGNTLHWSNLQGSPRANWALIRMGTPGGPNGSRCVGDRDCDSGFCVDGFCCDSACGGGVATDCIGCSATLTGGRDGACGVVMAGTECRAADGVCDVPEACDGSGRACPADGFAMAGTECRASAGDCDVAESCDGAGAVCPDDGFAMAGTECRASAGDCDVAESCDGAGTACPDDGFAMAGTECRASAGACDVAESCDGMDVACPEDMFMPDGTMCDDGMVCNGVEMCMGGACAMAMALNCDDGMVCTADMCVEPTGCTNEPIADCCSSDADCADSDECTMDTCDMDTGMCSNTPIMGCGMPDAGIMDAGPPPGAEPMDEAGPGPGPAPMEDGGCSCAVVGTGSEAPSGPLALLTFVGILGLVLRRRRR